MICCTGGQIYRIRAALSVPPVARSEQDLALAMATLERWLMRQEPPVVDAPSNGQHGSDGGGGSRSSSRGNDDFETPLSTCSFGGLNYPDVAFDALPFLAFADHRFTRRKRGGGGGRSSSSSSSFSVHHDDDHYDDDERGATGSGGHRGGGYAEERGGPATPTAGKKVLHGDGGAAADDADTDTAAPAAPVSPYVPIARLFLRLCPSLGAYVAPWLESYAGSTSLAPRLNGRQLGEEDGRVRVVFVSSRFGNHGTTKVLAALMRFLPRQHFEVWL